jgi:aminoglycoside phosphotransferase (APT) family kinase protein
MALSNRTDPQHAERQLATWLASKLDGAHDVRVFDARVPSDAGLSAETVLFDASWVRAGANHSQSLVARVRPSGESVFPSYDFAAEFRVLAALGRGGLPVPEVLWHERDPSVLGGEFIVMERVDGRVPSDDPPYTVTGWVLDLDHEQQAALYDNALKALAAIHAVDWKAAGLDLLDRRELGAPGLDQQLAYWSNFYEWAAVGEPNPTVEAAFDWVRENRSADEQPLALNWGDARVGNILFADDMSVAGVLDWEMVSLASRELDLGWWLFLMRYHTEGIGAPKPPGFPDRDETVARYRQLTGHPVEHIEFYEVFAALRLSIIMHRAGNMMIAVGLLPPDAPMKFNNPASQLLAKLIGVAAPGGEAQSFVGNRG